MGGFVRVPLRNHALRWGAQEVHALNSNGLKLYDDDGNVAIEIADGGTIARMILGNSTDAVAGNIRWDGTNFQGYDGTTWANLGGLVQAVPGGPLEVYDPGALASESLNETDFATHAKWDVAGDFLDSGGNAAYTHSGGTGTLTQTSGNLAIAGEGLRWYKLTYTVSGVTGDPAATVTTAFLGVAYPLNLTAGTWTALVKATTTPGNFVISATSTSGGFTLDDLSMKEVIGGDFVVHGNSEVKGNSGVKNKDVWGANADGVYAMGPGTPPTTAPADLFQMWAADYNGVAGYMGPYFMVETNALALSIPGVYIKADTGNVANPFEGLIQINTFDNTVQMYADGSWQSLIGGGGGRTQGSSTGDGTTEISWVTDHGYYLTFGAQNEAITFVAPSAAGAELTLVLKQDSVGNRLVTSWPALIIRPGQVEPVLSTGANEIDIFHYYWDGAKYQQYGYASDES